ncbi:MAG: putative metal-dependent hydrolase [Bacteroidetes bacterium]|nr:putative metal-dependent hydrolase [Bacteroidota bacterium]MBS1541935.1 putative metal-dependent hydrolase [Bacteroidota bacterium]
MELFLKPDTWLALLTLCFLEIVLGIDNIIFISIVSNKLPEEQRQKARNTGLFLAMFVRIGFLLGITWIIGFKEPLFAVKDIFPDFLIKYFHFHGDHTFSGRDLILGFGGLFLIAKSTMEINHEMEGDGETKEGKKSAVPTLAGTIVQIILLDIIFSFDSILTAVGIVDRDKVIIMIMAVIVSIGVMMFFSGSISRFIQKHPSMEVLALGFLILIGFMLFLESLEIAVPKGYIYFAVAFSLLIEFFNIRVISKRKADPVKLYKPFSEAEAQEALSQKIEEIQYSDDPKYPIGKFVSKENYTQEELQQLIEKIDLFPYQLQAVVENLSEAQLDTPYREGGWTVRQLVHHLSDSHLNAYVRVKWALTEETPTIKAYNQTKWAETPDTRLSVEYPLAMIKSLHRKWVGLLKQLLPDQLKKEYVHPDTGKHTRLDQMTASYAWHGEHHLAHIKSLKKRMNW